MAFHGFCYSGGLVQEEERSEFGRQDTVEALKHHSLITMFPLPLPVMGRMSTLPVTL
jgi:hypothetical protein